MRWHARTTIRPLKQGNSERWSAYAHKRAHTHRRAHTHTNTHTHTRTHTHIHTNTRTHTRTHAHTHTHVQTHAHAHAHAHANAHAHAQAHTYTDTHIQDALKSHQHRSGTKKELSRHTHTQLATPRTQPTHNTTRLCNQACDASLRWQWRAPIITQMHR